MTTTIETSAPIARGRSGAVPLGPPPAPRGRRRRAGLTFARRCVGPLALLGLWWIGSTTGLFSDRFLPSPAHIVSTGSDLIGSGTLGHHVGASRGRAGKGLLIGGGVGLVLDVLAGLSTRREELLDPLMQMLGTVPFIALIPLFIVWFGIGETSEVALIALACAFSMYLNAYSGVRSVDAKIVEAARSFRQSRLHRVGEIVLPEDWLVAGRRRSWITAAGRARRPGHTTVWCVPRAGCRRRSRRGAPGARPGLPDSVPCFSGWRTSPHRPAA